MTKVLPNPNSLHKINLGITWLGLGVTVISCIFLLVAIQRNLSALSEISPGSFVSLLLASVIYASTAFFIALAWLSLVRSTSTQKFRLIHAVIAHFISQIGKYLPGNVAHQFGRVYLAKRYGLNTGVAISAAVLELIWVIAVTLVLGGITLWSLRLDISEFGPGEVDPSMIAGAVAVLMFGLWVGSKLLPILGNWWVSKIEKDSVEFQCPSFAPQAFSAVLYCANFFIQGMVMLLILKSMLNVDGVSLFIMAGGYALAWIIGFITPGAPAGLGVREVALIFILSPELGSENAVMLAAITRVVTTIGDLIVFLAGLCLVKLHIGEGQEIEAPTN